MDKQLDLAGVGIGPFNLSLAAILDKTALDYKFFDQKSSFDWHSEILFSDSDMQTSYLKDLVTPVDPTSRYSFLNYLVENGLFHVFMNTGRTNVTRKEFERYCQWTSSKLENRLQFNSPIIAVDYDGKSFVLQSKNETYRAKNICIGTGLTPRVPECTVEHLSKNFFHAKSPELKNLNLEGKDVLVIGGGQTGVEIFRNALNNKWSRPKSIKLVTGRMGLLPLDESPFTNEYFSPAYVENFFDVSLHTKEGIVKAQKYASDGNTPHYLEGLYQELYQRRFVQGDNLDFEICPSRRLSKVENMNGRYRMVMENHFTNGMDEFQADIVILCTGFDVSVPKMIEPMRTKIMFDENGRFQLNKDFTVKWEGPNENKIFALNFSRHMHGISEPQTSLMAWRSAVVTNTILNENFYQVNNQVRNFMNYR